MFWGQRTIEFGDRGLLISGTIALFQRVASRLKVPEGSVFTGHRLQGHGSQGHRPKRSWVKKVMGQKGHRSKRSRVKKVTGQNGHRS